MVLIRKFITNKDIKCLLAKRGYKIYTIKTWTKILNTTPNYIPNCCLYKKYGYKTEEERVYLIKHLIYWLKNKDTSYFIRPFSNPGLKFSKYPTIDYFNDIKIAKRIINDEINYYIL